MTGDLPVYLLAILLVGTSLQRRDAGEEDESQHHEQGANHSQPLCCNQDRRTDNKRTPPDTNLTQVIGMSGEPPQANIAPLVFVHRRGLEDKLLVICNCLIEESKKEDHSSHNVCNADTALQRHWRVDKNHRQTDNIDPNDLDYPENKKLDGVPPDLIKAFVFAGSDDPNQ